MKIAQEGDAGALAHFASKDYGMGGMLIRPVDRDQRV